MVEDIRREIEASKGTHIWRDYVNALNLISQVVFTRSSGCILELIQNAEDAGQGMESPGIFEIGLSPTRLKICHNARPFGPDDVKAVCGIRSSKKPERGTLGYLGIGFKSVFKVADRAEIYSGGFQFKFERPKESANPTETPWHVIPIWIDEPSEDVDSDKTTFILPLREKESYSAVLADLENLGTELYLFLRWLKKIEVVDEGAEQRWALESVGETDDVTTFLRGDQEYRFRIFRHTVNVPDWVKQDRLTQQYRANVSQRQIAIAFALDDQGNLKPSEAGAMYGGVYSFLPLGQARSGAKFPIQADFLVQPGRDAINFEAKWNGWLLDEVVALCRDAVRQFKAHPLWKYQFLPAFDFTKFEGLEAYEKLFGPRLIKPLEDFINEDACVPTRDGGWARPKEVVVVEEDEKAIEALESLGVLARGEIAGALGGQSGLQLAHPAVQDRISAPLIKVGRKQLLENADYLERMAKSPSNAQWFRSLYTWLLGYPQWERWRPTTRHNWRQRHVRYHSYEIVLAADNSLHRGGDVFLPDVSVADATLAELAHAVKATKPLLHAQILSEAHDSGAMDKLKGFLTGYTGVQLLDGRQFAEKRYCPEYSFLLRSQRPATLSGTRVTAMKSSGISHP